MLFSVRRATFDDVPAVLAIERQSASAAHWTSEQYDKLLDSGVVLVAEEAVVEEAGAAEAGTGKARQLRGFVCARAVAGEWEIENIVVPPDFWRRGIATALLQALTGQARSEAASAILLEVRESNSSARKLYEKHGFREAGRRRRYYGDPTEDAILFRFSI